MIAKLQYPKKVKELNVHVKQEQEEIMKFAREHRGFCMDTSKQ
jgi:hypothetical protein